jgi:hypothetical protein
VKVSEVVGETERGGVQKELRPYEAPVSLRVRAR